MRIAVYSGSFNPLHVGHLAIMRCLSGMDDIGLTYLIVSPKNPLKDNISEDSGKERFDAAVRAVARYPELRVAVNDIELRLPPPQYTIRTLDELKRLEPEHDFVLVIGADNLAAFTKWRDYGRILREYGVLVYPREGFDCGEIRESLMRECQDYMIEILKAPMVDISSTDIRNGIGEGKDIADKLM